MIEPKDLLAIRWHPGMLARSRYFEHTDRRAALLASLLGRNGRVQPGLFLVGAESDGELVSVTDSGAAQLRRSFCAVTRSGSVLIGQVGDGSSDTVQTNDGSYICAAELNEEPSVAPTVEGDGQLPLRSARVSLRACTAAELRADASGTLVPLSRIGQSGERRRAGGYLPPVLRLETVDCVDPDIRTDISAVLHDVEVLTTRQAAAAPAGGLGPRATRWAAELIVLRAILISRCAVTRDSADMTPQSFRSELVAPLVSWFGGYRACFRPHAALEETERAASRLGTITDDDLCLGVGELLHGFKNFLDLLHADLASM